VDTGSRQREGIDLMIRLRTTRSATLTAVSLAAGGLVTVAASVAAGVAVSAAMSVTASTAASAAEPRTVQRQVPADPRGVVIINNVGGSIEVSGWDKPQVAATANLGGEGLGLAVTTEDGQTHVRITGYGDDTTGFGRGFFNFFEHGGVHGDADLSVHVPRQSRVEATAVSATIHSAGVAGTQRLQSVSGDIRAELAAADADIRTVSGDILLRGNDQEGHLRASSVSGDVTLSHGAGDLQATTISGNVQADLRPGRTLRLHTTSGDITVSGVLARAAIVQAETLSGRVSIQASAPDGFAYDVRSFTGNIDDCFGQPPVHNSEYGPGMHMTGTRGGGDDSVHIKTLSGEISLCDH
jgi:Toastrack DUF4097